MASTQGGTDAFRGISLIDQIQSWCADLAADPADGRAGLPDLAHAEDDAADQAAADQARGSSGSVALGRRRRLRRGQARAARGGRVPAQPRALQEARRDGAEGHPAARPARHRQDACSPRRSPASPAPTSSASPRARSSRCSPASARRASAASSRSRRSTLRRSSSSTSSTRSGCSAASTSRARRTRRSTSCWSRWTASQERGDLIVIAASNRVDGLDPALLRPGRFDRQVLVSPPDLKGREQILQGAHAQQAASRTSTSSMVARRTSGLTGADLANLCNEAAIFAGREGRDDDRAGGLRRRARAGGRRPPDHAA